MALTSTAAEILYPQLKSETSASVQFDKARRAVNGNVLPPPFPIKDTMAAAPPIPKIAEVEPARPKLAFPNLRLHRKPLELEMVEAETLGSKSLHELVAIARETFDIECVNYKKHSEEAITTWINFQEKNQTSASWTLFRQAVSYGGTAASVVIASVAIANGGGLFAYLLFASGAINLGREVATELGLLNKHPVLQIGLASISLASGAVSGYLTVSALQGANYVEIAKQITTNVGNIAGGAAVVGEGVSKARAKDAEKAHLQSQERSSDHRSAVHDLSAEFASSAKKEQNASGSSSDLMEQFAEQLEIINSRNKGG